MSIVIRPGREEDVDQVYRFMNEQKETLPFLGGFSSRDDYLKHFTTGNEKGSNNLVAVEGDTVLGCSISKPRGHYQEQDFNAVVVDHRRQKIGSHLYKLHQLRAMLAGRLFILDQIVHFNPYMPPFLESLNFKYEAHLRQKIRNFSGLKYYRFELAKHEPNLPEWDHKFEYELYDYPAYADTIVENMKLLRKLEGEDSQRALQLENNREYIFEQFKVQSHE